jgi:hypothetical protein
MAACTEPLLGSLAREQTERLLNDTADAIEQSEAQTRQLAAQQTAHYRRLISDLCDGIGRMATRMDAFLTREVERQRIAAEEASRTELRTALDTLPDVLDAPRGELDDDAPHGELPAPSLEPSLRESDSSQQI